jgi:hypothetical protein
MIPRILTHRAALGRGRVDKERIWDGGLPMLTRDKLTTVQWQAVRNTPHHVIIAVSASGGSAFDEMLERSAGLQAIVDAINSTHPLVSEIGGSTHIMHAQDEVRKWFYTLDETHRTPARLQEKALETARHALDALGTHGTAEDLMHYGEFVLSLAMRVARAAREGDIMGIGGELVSESERRFIDRLDQIIKEKK